jgi:hypothetical protein
MGNHTLHALFVHKDAHSLARQCCVHLSLLEFTSLRSMHEKLRQILALLENFHCTPMDFMVSLLGGPVKVQGSIWKSFPNTRQKGKRRERTRPSAQEYSVPVLNYVIHLAVNPNTLARLHPPPLRVDGLPPSCQSSLT